MRHRRGLLLVLLATTFLLGLVGPAGAIGAQGVDLTPILPREGGTLTAVVEPDVVIPLRLTNTTEEPRVVEVYPAATNQTEGGGTGVGGAIDWITIDGARALQLDPGQVVELEAVVDVATFRELAASELAVDEIVFVLEVVSGGNVTPRAATIVALKDGGAPIPMPVAIVLLATILLIMVAAAWWRFGRPMRGTPAGPDEPATLAPLPDRRPPSVRPASATLA